MSSYFTPPPHPNFINSAALESAISALSSNAADAVRITRVWGSDAQHTAAAHAAADGSGADGSGQCITEITPSTLITGRHFPSLATHVAAIVVPAVATLPQDGLTAEAFSSGPVVTALHTAFEAAVSAPVPAAASGLAPASAHNTPSTSSSTLAANGARVAADTRASHSDSSAAATATNRGGVVSASLDAALIASASSTTPTLGQSTADLDQLQLQHQHQQQDVHNSTGRRRRCRACHKRQRPDTNTTIVTGRHRPEQHGVPLHPPARVRPSHPCSLPRLVRESAARAHRRALTLALAEAAVAVAGPVAAAAAAAAGGALPSVEDLASLSSPQAARLAQALPALTPAFSGLPVTLPSSSGSGVAATGTGAGTSSNSNDVGAQAAHVRSTDSSPLDARDGKASSAGKSRSGAAGPGPVPTQGDVTAVLARSASIADQLAVAIAFTTARRALAAAKRDWRHNKLLAAAANKNPHAKTGDSASAAAQLLADPMLRLARALLHQNKVKPHAEVKPLRHYRVVLPWLWALSSVPLAPGALWSPPLPPPSAEAHAFVPQYRQLSVGTAVPLSYANLPQQQSQTQNQS